MLLLFTAPPSLPACLWFGDAVVGGSVSLSCSVSEGVPTPDLHWDKLDPEETSLPINMEGQLLLQDQLTAVQVQILHSECFL